MLKKDYDEIIREHLDLSDRPTRQYLVSLDEAGQDKLLDTLAESLYDSIVEKVDEIDFGTIPLSRGDITKVENFDKTEKCLDIIRKLVLEYKQNPKIVDVVLSAIQNMKDLKAQFIKGYALDVEFPMLMYNLMVLCIVRSTSMMIATCVKYISDPQTKSFKQALDAVSYKDTQDDVMFKQLDSFNNLCKDGTMMKLLTSAIKNNGKLHEDFADGWAQNTPEDNKQDTPLVPSVQPADEEDSPFDDTPAENPFTSNDTAPNPSPAAEPEDLPAQEPITGEDVPDDVPVEEPEDNSEPVPVQQPTTDPQTDDLPVTEPDDTNEPAPYVEPVQPEAETAPDVNPNPETDTELTPKDAPIIEYEPGEEMEEGVIEGLANKVKDVATDTWKRTGVAGKAAVIAGTVLSAIAVTSVLKFALFRVIIPLLRDSVYTFYHTMFKISEYWKIQAEFLEANADELENTTSDMDPDKKEKVIKKQRKWAETFRKWSNLFNLDKSSTKKAVEKDKKEDEKNKKKVATNDDGEDVLF